MKFILTEPLKQRMLQKGFENIIISSKVRSCWTGTYAEVSAKFSETPGKDTFEHYEVDGFNIYVQAGIRFAKDTVTLNYEKMLIFERISIDGLDYGR